MIDSEEIDRIFRKYLISAYCSAAVLFIMVMLVSRFCFERTIDGAGYFGVVYSFVLMTGVAFTWRWIMKKHEGSILNFQIAVSALRFLSALFTLTGCYIVVGRVEIAPYAIVLMIFYLLIISHHSLFFMLNNSFKR